MKNQRRTFSAAFKAKVAIEAIKEQQTVAKLNISFVFINYSTTLTKKRFQLLESPSNLLKVICGYAPYKDQDQRVLHHQHSFYYQGVL